MPDKIFYSWQSDLPNPTNRGFIEDALKKAIRNLGQAENEIFAPNRMDIELDKDTQGIPGSPPIADTIFKKIEECAVFVADLTFTGRTDEGLPTPNPNVLIEYGWALAKVGRAKIVGVMNTAHGEPTTETVPFNIRHTRWPHTFALRDDGTEDDRRAAKQKLVSFFEGAIRDALAAPSVSQASFTPLEPKSRVSSFLDPGDLLGISQRVFPIEQAKRILWHDGPQLFMRVIPDVLVGPYPALAILKMLEGSRLVPFGCQGSVSHSMGNEWGAVTVTSRDTEAASPHHITQVTEHGEIWGIDNYTLQTNGAVPFIENNYAHALSGFLRFAKEQLGVTSPVKVIAGMSGVRGLRIFLPSPGIGRWWPKPFDVRDGVGSAAKDDIVSEIPGVAVEQTEDPGLEFDDRYQIDKNVGFRHAYKTLIPYFVRVWHEFQKERPPHLPNLAAMES